MADENWFSGTFTVNQMAFNCTTGHLQSSMNSVQLNDNMFADIKDSRVHLFNRWTLQSEVVMLLKMPQERNVDVMFTFVLFFYILNYILGS